MYMRRLIVLFAVWVLCCLPFKGICQTAADLNASIQEATDEIYTKASLWGTTFLKEYNGSQNYGNLSGARSELELYIERKLKEFKKKQDVDGSEKLRAALIAFLEFEKKLVTEGFQPFERLSSSSGDDQVSTCRSHLKELSVGEGAVTSTLNVERKAYAEKNDISLVPPAPERPMPTKHSARKRTAKPVAAPPQREEQHEDTKKKTGAKDENEEKDDDKE